MYLKPSLHFIWRLLHLIPLHLLATMLKNNGEEFQKVAKNIDEMGLALTNIEVEQLAQGS